MPSKHELDLIGCLAAVSGVAFALAIGGLYWLSGVFFNRK